MPRFPYADTILTVKVILIDDETGDSDPVEGATVTVDGYRPQTTNKKGEVKYTLQPGYYAIGVTPPKNTGSAGPTSQPILTKPEGGLASMEIPV